MKIQPQVLKLSSLGEFAPGTVVCMPQRGLCGIVALNEDGAPCIFVTNGQKPFTCWVPDDRVRFLAIASAAALRVCFEEGDRPDGDSEIAGTLVLTDSGAAIVGWHIEGGFEEPLFLQLTNWRVTERRDYAANSIAFARWSLERLVDDKTNPLLALPVPAVG